MSWRQVKLRILLPRVRLWGGFRRAAIAVAWVVGSGALLSFAFGTSFYFAMMAELKSTEVKVPDLGGLSLDAAAAQVEELELVLEVVDQQHDPSVASDLVLQQVPTPGSSVRRGRKVKLILSLGGRVLEVPDLVGRAARAVDIGLRQQGFTPGFEVGVPSEAPVGTVLSQVPPATTPALPETRVHRLVSSGPAQTAWVMPDLTGLSTDVAEGWVRRSGFRATVRRVRMGGQRSGTVVGQLPLSGYPIRSRDIVELTVAR